MKPNFSIVEVNGIKRNSILFCRGVLYTEGSIDARPIDDTRSRDCAIC